MHERVFSYNNDIFASGQTSYHCTVCCVLCYCVHAVMFYFSAGYDQCSTNWYQCSHRSRVTVCWCLLAATSGVCFVTSSPASSRRLEFTASAEGRSRACTEVTVSYSKIHSDSTVAAVPVKIYISRTNTFSVVFPRLKYWSLFVNCYEQFWCFQAIAVFSSFIVQRLLSVVEY